MEELNKINENEKDKIEKLKTKIYDLFLILEENKYYRSYVDYGLFLYDKIRMFDKGLEIFKEGYENKHFDCGFYYFQAYTKSSNIFIDNKNALDSNKYINIIQPLIDSFIFDNTYSLNSMFEYFYIIGKRYNLFSQLSNKYMKYLNEIAEICKSFAGKIKRNEGIIEYTNDKMKYTAHVCFYTLSLIYQHGITTKFKKNLIKAIKYANKAKDYVKECEPFFTRKKFKIKVILFKLGAIKDKNKLIQLANKVYELYKKNENYEYYGNTYYYYFGKLYEKGIGTQKNDKLALSYYQKGAKPLHNIYDSFLMVYKRYLSIEKLNSKKYKLNMNNEPKYNIFFCLSIGVNINLLIHIK